MNRDKFNLWDLAMIGWLVVIVAATITRNWDSADYALTQGMLCLLASKLTDLTARR